MSERPSFPLARLPLLAPTRVQPHAVGRPGCVHPGAEERMARTPPHAQVASVEVQVGGETRSLPASLVVVGIGARPNVELFTGTPGVELAPAPLGGIKVRARRPFASA